MRMADESFWGIERRFDGASGEGRGRISVRPFAGLRNEILKYKNIFQIIYLAIIPV